MVKKQMAQKDQNFATLKPSISYVNSFHQKFQAIN